MRTILNHLVGIILTILLTLFLGVIGFIIGVAIWALSVWGVQRAQDRKLMNTFLESQLDNPNKAEVKEKVKTVNTVANKQEQWVPKGATMVEI